MLKWLRWIAEREDKIDPNYELAQENLISPDTAPELTDARETGSAPETTISSAEALAVLEALVQSYDHRVGTEVGQTTKPSRTVATGFETDRLWRPEKPREDYLVGRTMTDKDLMKPPVLLRDKDDWITVCPSCGATITGMKSNIYLSCKTCRKHIPAELLRLLEAGATMEDEEPKRIWLESEERSAKNRKYLKEIAADAWEWVTTCPYCHSRIEGLDTDYSLYCYQCKKRIPAELLRLLMTPPKKQPWHKRIFRLKRPQTYSPYVRNEILMNITNMIEAELTGEAKHDVPYLLEQCNKYDNHEFESEIMWFCGRLLFKYMKQNERH